MISAIVPVYNNQTTIKRVLKVLANCGDIDEIFVIDDASQDKSLKIIKSALPNLGPKVKLIVNQENLGKGGAVVKGIKQSRGEVILLCDADLAKLEQSHIEYLINEHKKGYEQVVMCRGKGRNWIAKLSGERIFYRETINPYLEKIKESGNGIEQIINFSHNHHNKKTKFVTAPKDTGHVIKYQRKDKIEAAREYVREGWQLLETEFILQELRLRKKLIFLAQKIKYYW